MKDENIKRWLDNNCHLGKLISYSVQPVKPEIGFYIELGDIEVPHDVFPEEYDELVKINYKILKKLENYYDNLKKQE
jgi:hypothetical protein